MKLARPGPQCTGPARAGGASPRLRRRLCAVALVLAATWGALAAPGARAQGALSAIEADVDQIVTRARPSIVTIVAQSTEVSRERPGGPPQRRPHSRVGSGVAVADDEILTTVSVVLGAQKVFVVRADGRQFEAELAGLDPIRNVALLRVPGQQFAALRLAPRPAALGDWVIALGCSYRAAPTQSVGNIAYRFREPRLSLLQLTNVVYPGNSGGAALNSRGELIGLVQGELGAPEGAGSEGERRPGGAGFVIPSEDVRFAWETLRRDGHMRLGWLGVSTQAGFVDSDTQPGLRVALGAIVEAMLPGGPADKLGLRKGDLIVAFENERVEYPEQLARWVAATPPGTVVSVVWAHNELRRAGRVALGESPTSIPTWMLPDTSETPPPASAATPPRIADLEAQIRRLNRQLGQLRSRQDSTR